MMTRREHISKRMTESTRKWIWKWCLAYAGATAFLCHHEVTEAQSVILLNQLGHRPNDPKVALIRDIQRGPFEIINVATNKSVFQGIIRAIGNKDVSSGDIVFSLDFTQLTKPGRYQIWLPDLSSTSVEFTINIDIYNPVVLQCLESFYFQRCGTSVGSGTAWEHPACHTGDAVFYHNQKESKDVTGGWHDAGDYNKFIPTTAVSLAFLLYLYEDQSEKFYDGQLKIPEAGNRVPDLLDEARWGLEWLLKMQSAEGGVYHKVSIKQWTGEHLPHGERDTRYIFDISSTSTGDFAAVTALGARFFDRWDKGFAKTLLGASIRAWEFLEKNSAIVPAGGFRNPPDVNGGEYGDTRDADERLWAAAELYRTTGNNRYLKYIMTNYKSVGGINYTVGWQNVQNFAYYSMLKLPAHSLDLRVRSFITTTLINYADNLLGRIEQSGYRYVLTPEEYYWGSNSVALGYAFDLIQTFQATKSLRYLQGALDQLHYTLGRNPVNIVFVTGIGANPVKHPYHQFSMVLRAGKPVPGLVVGGANRYGKLRGKTLSEFPGKCYEDNEKNYYVNEVAINYTAPLVYVAGYLSELSKTPKTATTNQ